MHFGYKDHVKCDAESKLITNYGVTDAAVHDSQCCTDLLEETDKVIYADSAYSGGEIAENLPDGCENQICEKGTRNHPLTDEQKESTEIQSSLPNRTHLRLHDKFHEWDYDSFHWDHTGMVSNRTDKSGLQHLQIRVFKTSTKSRG